MTEGTDESLAKALGIEECACFGWPAGSCHRANGDHFDSGNDDGLPNWSESFDACLRDIVPVLRARGWGYWSIAAETNDGRYFEAQIWSPNDIDRVIMAVADSVPAAFCEAALAALEATNG